MNLWKILKATAMLMTMFKDVDSCQEMVDLYRIDTGKEIEVTELINKTSDELQNNPKTQDFIEWVTDKIREIL